MDNPGQDVVELVGGADDGSTITVLKACTEWRRGTRSPGRPGQAPFGTLTELVYVDSGRLNRAGQRQFNYQPPLSA